MVDAFLTLALLWLVAAMTPGPNFFAVMQVAAGQGRRAAIACAGGTVLGTAVWALAGFFGLKALFAALPAAALAIKLLGACYLVWVGVEFWRSASRPDAAHPPKAVHRAFMFGLATNLANPKTAAFAASLFAVALPPDAPVSVVFLAIAMVCAISTAWYGIVSFIGSGRTLGRAYMRARGSVLRLTGVIFAGYGAQLGVEAAAEV